MVRFLEDPEEYKTCEMIEHIDSSISRYGFETEKIYHSCTVEEVRKSVNSNNIWMCVIELQNHETVKEADNNG